MTSFIFPPYLPDYRNHLCHRHQPCGGGAAMPMAGSSMFGGRLTATPDGIVTTPGGYTIDVSAASDGGQATITSPNGETSRIWGDPHFDQNGVRQFDFKGTTTFTLPDKTKLTVSTQQNSNGSWSSDRMTITNGADGVSYGNLNGSPVGMSMSTGYGPRMDAAISDGNELYLGRDNVVRGLNGFGGMSVATQQYINATDEISNPYGAYHKDATAWLEKMLGGSYFSRNFLSNYGGCGLMSSFFSPRYPSFGPFDFAYMPGMGRWQSVF